MSDTCLLEMLLKLEFLGRGKLVSLNTSGTNIRNIRVVWLLVQREVAEHIVAALDAGGGSMDQLCRLLLAADSYSVVLLRSTCLAGLAQAFHSLEHHTAREQATFEAFVEAVAPKVCILFGPGGAAA